MIQRAHVGERGTKSDLVRWVSVSQKGARVKEHLLLKRDARMSGLRKSGHMLVIGVW